MELEDEIMDALSCNNLFGKDENYVIKKLSNSLGIKSKRIENALKKLQKSKNISVIDGKFVKNNQFVEKNKTFENLTQIGTIIKNGDNFAVKLRGYENKFCGITNTKMAKDNVGKTCLIKLNNNSDAVLLGEVQDVYGFADDPISENIAIAAKYGFSNKFSEDVLNEASAIPQVVTEKQRENRENLEYIPFLTIDPEGCKDKDDAIFDEPIKDGFRTYIAIADVSSGVLPGSALDKEAFKRGNSAYLGGGVYPMLPPELSNGIFSLDEGKARLAVVAQADISYSGKISNIQVRLAVIKVKKSYSYAEAEKTYKNEENFENINQKTKKSLDFIYKNTKILEKMQENKLEFDSHEPQYKFSADGKTVEDITLSNEEYSHKVVETRMILANEIVAGFFKERGYLGLYRTHEDVKVERLIALRKKLKNFNIGYDLKNTTESFKVLIEGILKQHPARDYLMGETVRTLSKAKYEATKTDVSHFGLGVNNDDLGYMHFTSPIRRYSDLITHRFLKDILLGKMPNISYETLSLVANHLNLQEKKADRAEAESDRYLACLWAEKHKNIKMSGYISQITDGMFKVMTANGTVPVLIPFSEVTSKNVKVSENGMEATFDNHAISLGDNLNLEITNVDIESRTISGKFKEFKKEKEENRNF